MKSKHVKRMLATGLATAMSLMLMAGCGKTNDDKGEGTQADGTVKGSEATEETTFGWWIYETDSDGQYFETYEEAAVPQWIGQQYWDAENGGIGEGGKKLKFSYTVPITGSENENFNTMIGTGEYPEIIDMVVSPETPQALHDNGIVMDITKYVEEYMPNYLAYLDANPELKPLVQTKEEDGSIHYYAIYPFLEGLENPWQGTCYRRDWVVKYAEPTDYVWDWDSDYVKENGHPEVTPLAKAKKEKNMEGWKENDVKSFEANYEADTETGYEDNVIFPSGQSNPLTISDWEWMFEAFAKAIDERGWSDDSSSYPTSVYYIGYMETGDLTSSFGGGTGQYYVKDGVASFDGDSENFKTYLECLNTWYKKGWLDAEFNTRANDRFFLINSAGVTQGKVGLWDGQTHAIGTSIRSTCQNEEDARDAYVMGASLPINDVYGGKDQMYKEPDALYQTSRIGSPTAITTKAEGKDLATLFTFLDWTYTREGALVIREGLNEEQYASAKLDPDLYAERGLKSAYTTSIDEDGKTVYTRAIDPSDTATNAVIGQRMDVGLKLQRSDDYRVERGTPPINQAAFDQWTKYLNTGNVMDYVGLLNVEESEKYNKVSTAVSDYQNQYVPQVIKGTMSWEDYVKGFESIDPDSVVEYLQKYVDLAKTS